MTRAITPVIIVGAARSGTNMLRDCLTRLPGFATWDCDEINPVWRHGHFFRRDDELQPADLTVRGRRAIAKAFGSVAADHPEAQFIVEKTCANSLRLGYVDAAVEHARFVRIVRDGRDVVASACKRWRGELEVDARSYFLAKARHTPIVELPLYIAAFVAARVAKLFGRSERLSAWGPRYRGIDADRDQPLRIICARQWAASVDRSDAYLDTLPPDRWLSLRYEDFVADPSRHMRLVVDFLGATASDAEIAAATADIATNSVGKGRDAGDNDANADVLADLGATLARHGYSVPEKRL